MTGNKGQEKNIPFLDHIEELRRRILISVCFFLAASIVSFVFIDRIMIILQKPIEGHGIDLHYFKPHEKFFTYVKTAVFSGLAASVPFIFFQLFRFIAPALKHSRRKVFFLSLFSMILLFFGGCYFSYSTIGPTAFKFFINFASDAEVAPVWGIGAYYDLLFKVVFLIGLAFELPVILLFLVAMDVISLRALARGRKIALLVAFVFGAVLTPPDLFTQLLVGATLYILYEATIITARIVTRKRSRLREYV